MTGIGFIGGGAIVKEGHGVRGTATAASIWVTGIIGASVAHGRFGIAVLISLLAFLTLKLLTPVEHKIGKNDHPEDEKT
jgi:putative Mg2+ transporter-C (MgtC) family protein